MDSETYGQRDILTVNETYLQTDRHSYIWTERWMDSLTDRQKDRWTVNETYRQRDRQTKLYMGR